MHSGAGVEDEPPVKSVVTARTCVVGTDPPVREVEAACSVQVSTGTQRKGPRVPDTIVGVREGGRARKALPLSLARSR